jgi:hypothetical protein
MCASYAISRDEAIEIYREVEEERKTRRGDLTQRLSDAKAYARTHIVGGERLADTFDIPLADARQMCSDAQYFRRHKRERGTPDPKSAKVEVNSDAVAVYTKRNSTFAAVESVLAKLNSTPAVTQNNFSSVIPDKAVPRSIPVPVLVEPKRMRRRFCDISGTDATADQRRYPSGIGFAVVESVR